MLLQAHNEPKEPKKEHLVCLRASDSSTRFHFGSALPPPGIKNTIKQHLITQLFTTSCSLGRCWAERHNTVSSAESSADVWSAGCGTASSSLLDSCVSHDLWHSSPECLINIVSVSLVLCALCIWTAQSSVWKPQAAAGWLPSTCF